MSTQFNNQALEPIVKLLQTIDADVKFDHAIMQCIGLNDDNEEVNLMLQVTNNGLILSLSDGLKLQRANLPTSMSISEAYKECAEIIPILWPNLDTKAGMDYLHSLTPVFTAYKAIEPHHKLIRLFTNAHAISINDVFFHSPSVKMNVQGGIDIVLLDEKFELDKEHLTSANLTDVGWEIECSNKNKLIYVNFYEISLIN